MSKLDLAMKDFSGGNTTPQEFITTLVKCSDSADNFQFSADNALFSEWVNRVALIHDNLVDELTKFANGEFHPTNKGVEL